MDSENMVMVEKVNAPKVISISIVRGSELSEVARAREGINRSDLVELRVERNSPANLKIIKLNKNQSPTSRFKEALKREGFLGNKIL